MADIFDRHIENLIRTNASLTRGAIEHYSKAGLCYVDVPQIVGITGACENIDTLFRVGNRLDLPLFFSQTGQLALEQALTFAPGVYTIIHSGRDEEEEDERHLRQFRLTEEEFDCTMAGMAAGSYDEERMFESLLFHIESTVKSMVREVVKDHALNLSTFYGQDVVWLTEVLDWPFLRISYDEAIELLKENGYSQLSFGSDLKAEHEQEVVNLINKKYGRHKYSLPVFITRYPKEIKFFNMKVSAKDSRVVLSSDLILPTAGEAVGSAVREHDAEKLKERLTASQMFKLHKSRGGSYKDFVWYVEGLVGSGKTNPHAGYGIGNERILQFILGRDDIRDCSSFYLFGQMTGDWDRARRGKLHLYSSHKKTILLSIGRLENKKKLLHSVKKIYNANTVLYATEKTHNFLAKEGIVTTKVYKISEGRQPNIKTLLEKGSFDIVVNIPTKKDGKVGSEETDGRKIRELAIDSGTTLVTEVEVAEYLFDKLSSLTKGREETVKGEMAGRFEKGKILESLSLSS